MTDEQIAIFRHSEVQRLLRARSENQDVVTAPSGCPEGEADQTEHHDAATSDLPTYQETPSEAPDREADANLNGRAGAQSSRQSTPVERTPISSRH